MNELSKFRFYSLEDREFMKAIGSWVYHPSCLLSDSRDLFQSVVENLEKVDEWNMNIIESKCYNIKQAGMYFQKASTKGFSILSCNTRSLPKNLSLLNDILLTVQEIPSVIAISEKVTRVYKIFLCLNMNSLAKIQKQMPEGQVYI